MSWNEAFLRYSGAVGVLGLAAGVPLDVLAGIVVPMVVGAVAGGLCLVGYATWMLGAAGSSRRYCSLWLGSPFGHSLAGGYDEHPLYVTPLYLVWGSRFKRRLGLRREWLTARRIAALELSCGITDSAYRDLVSKPPRVPR